MVLGVGGGGGRKENSVCLQDTILDLKRYIVADRQLKDAEELTIFPNRSKKAVSRWCNDYLKAISICADKTFLMAKNVFHREGSGRCVFARI